MSEELRYTLHYTRPSTLDDGRPCRIYTGENEADECVLKLGCHEWRFGRDPRNQTRWDYGLDRQISALKAAFDQGASHQKAAIRGVLREVIGL